MPLIARDKHQILVHTLRTIFHSAYNTCLRREGDQESDFKSTWSLEVGIGKRSFNNGILTIKAIPKSKSKPALTRGIFSVLSGGRPSGHVEGRREGGGEEREEEKKRPAVSSWAR